MERSNNNWGCFRTARAQHGHNTNYYVVYPGNTPANHPPTKACMIHSKQHRGCSIQDPGTCGKHQTKTTNPGCTSRGYRVQHSGPWDLWPPVVKNSRLFAQCGHSARCAPNDPCHNEAVVADTLLVPEGKLLWSTHSEFQMTSKGRRGGGLLLPSVRFKAQGRCMGCLCRPDQATVSVPRPHSALLGHRCCRMGPWGGASARLLSPPGQRGSDTLCTGGGIGAIPSPERMVALTPGDTAPVPPCPPVQAQDAPRVTFRRVVVSLRGPGQSPVLPFACCVGSLCSVSHCGRCSCWCRFRVRGAQLSVCWGCAGCGGMCPLRVSGAQ